MRPSKTWINRFAEAAGEAEEDEVRERWAKLLAGEIIQPGKFSLRTIEALRNLSPSEAQLFDRVCGYSLDGGALVSEGGAFQRASGIIYAELLVLDEAGLLTRDLAIQLPGRRPDFYEAPEDYFDKVLRFHSEHQPPDLVWKPRAHNLTRVGLELRALTPREADPKMLAELATMGRDQRIEARGTEPGRLLWPVGSPMNSAAARAKRGDHLFDELGGRAGRRRVSLKLMIRAVHQYMKVRVSNGSHLDIGIRHTPSGISNLLNVYLDGLSLLK